MLVCFPKFLNLGLSLTNPGNLVISKNTTFTVKSINPYSVDVVWSFTQIPGINVIKSNPNSITFLCTNTFTMQSFSVSIKRLIFSASTTFQLTCVNTPDNVQFLSIAATSFTFNWTGGLNDSSYRITTIPPTNTQTLQNVGYTKQLTFSNIDTSIIHKFVIDAYNSNNIYNQNTIINTLITSNIAYANAPENFNIGIIKASNIQLSWSLASNAIQYKIVSTPITSTQYALTSPYTFSNLIPGIPYTFTITSINQYNLLCGSRTTGQTQYATAPNNFNILQISPSNASLVWNASAGDVKYTVTASLSPQYINSITMTSNNYKPTSPNFILNGRAMALSSDGNTLYVPCLNDPVYNKNIIRIFTKTNGIWTNTSNIIDDTNFSNLNYYYEMAEVNQ